MFVYYVNMKNIKMFRKASQHVFSKTKLKGLISKFQMTLHLNLACPVHNGAHKTLSDKECN